MPETFSSTRTATPRTETMLAPTMRTPPEVPGGSDRRSPLGWPGAWAAAATFLGWETAHLVRFDLVLVIAAGIVAVAGVCACKGSRRPAIGRDLAALLAWAAGAALVAWDSSPPVSPDEIDRWTAADYFVAQGIAPASRATTEGRIHAVRIAGRWEPVSPPLRCTFYPALPHGRPFLVAGALRTRENRSGSYASLQVAGAYHLDPDAGAIAPPDEPRRTAWARRLVRAMGERTGSLAAAALLAERRALTDDVQVAFERTGTIHLLAISGFHVSILAAGAWFVARILTGGARVSRWIALGALVPYGALVGGPTSVVRALAMATLALLGPDTGRGLRAANALGWVAAVLPLLDPGQPATAGFCLSVSATAGVLLGGRWAIACSRWMSRHVRSGFVRSAGPILLGLTATSVGASILTTPWLLHFFALVYPWGTLANLAAIPAMALALPPLALASIAVLLEAPLASTLVSAADVLVECFLALLDLLAEGSGTWVLSGSLDRVTAGSAALLGAAVCWWTVRAFEAGARGGPTARMRERKAPRERRARHLIGLCLAVFTAATWGPVMTNRAVPEGETVVRFLDVGQGDAILVRGARECWLIDLGPGDWGARDRLVPELRRLGVNRLDRVWITHGDRDHWGGLRSLQRHGISCDTVSVSGAGAFPSPFWDAVAEGPGRPVVERVYAPWARTIGPLRFRLRYPWRGLASEDRNDGSFVWTVEREGEPWMLLVGDLEEAGYDRVLEAGVLGHAPVVQAGHHGSRTSAHRGAYEVLRPVLVVASLGAQNKFGFPHPELLACVDASRARLLRTDRAGAITFVVGPAGVRIRTEAGVDPLPERP